MQPDISFIQEEVRQMFRKPHARQFARALVSLGLLLNAPQIFASGQLKLIPTKNVQALTPENFCVGLYNVMKVSKQEFKDEAAILCSASGQPTQRLRDLVANPYAGAGQPVIAPTSSEDPATLTTNITVSYSMKIPKNAVKVLLGEEQHVSSVFQGENLSISAKFLPPPINLGEADTAFQIEQRTVVKDRVSFDDTSVHDLRLYRMFPNNFDMMMAVRTLSKPTQQFKKSVVIRGVLQDASNPNQALAFSVLNFSMNSREEHERVVQAFTRFIEADFMSLYNQQIKP